MLSFFKEDIALEITPVISLPAAGNKSLSTYVFMSWLCLF
jgi:hypothetical protein